MTTATTERQRLQMYYALEEAHARLHALPMPDVVLHLRTAYRDAWRSTCPREYQQVMEGSGRRKAEMKRLEAI